MINDNINHDHIKRLPLYYVLDQRFSTLGTGVGKHFTGGTQKFKKNSNVANLGRIFFGVLQRRNNFYLGLCSEQQPETTLCSKVFGRG